MSLETYKWAMETFPISATFLTVAILGIIGDVLAQTIVRGKQVVTRGLIDLERIKRMIYWAVIAAPVMNTWYWFINAMFPNPQLVDSVCKVTLDQTIWAISVNAFFFVFMGVLEGQSLHQARAQMPAKLKKAMKANWMIWPLVQFVNLGYLAPSTQILVANIVSVPWMCFLAYVANRSIPKSEVDDVV